MMERKRGRPPGSKNKSREIERKLDRLIFLLEWQIYRESNTMLEFDEWREEILNARQKQSATEAHGNGVAQSG